MFRRNVASALLSAEENEVVLGYLDHDSYSLAMAVVQVLAARPNPNEWTKEHVGVLVYGTNSNQTLHSLTLYDLDYGKVWEQVHYEGFFVRRPSSVLLTFEGDECVFGLSFADVGETTCFEELMDNKYKMEMRRKKLAAMSENMRIFKVEHERATANDSKVEKKETHLASEPLVVGGSAPKTEFATSKLKGSVIKIGGKLKNLPKRVKEGNKAAKYKIDRSQIGDPEDFVWIEHLGADKADSFGSVKLNPEVLKILEEIGLDPEKMRRREKKFARDFVKRETMIRKSLKNCKSIFVPPPPPLPVKKDPTYVRENLSNENRSWVNESVRRDGLLTDIRNGKKLTPVEPKTMNENSIGANISIAKALEKALAERRKLVISSDTESETSSNNAEWD